MLRTQQLCNFKYLHGWLSHSLKIIAQFTFLKDQLNRFSLAAIYSCTLFHYYLSNIERNNIPIKIETEGERNLQLLGDFLNAH